jgi:hypothetical protein
LDLLTRLSGFAIVRLAVPEEAFKFSVVKAPLVHQFNAIFSMQRTREPDLTYFPVPVRAKEFNLPYRTNLCLDLCTELSFKLSEKVLLHLLQSFLVTFRDTGNYLGQLLLGVKAVQDHNFKADIVQLIFFPCLFSFLFSFDAKHVYLL